MMSDENTTVDPGSLLLNEPYIRALARALVRGDDKVDDVVQETFRAALDRKPRNSAALRSWLGTITRNFAFRLRERDASRTRRERACAREDLLPSTTKIIEREEVRRRVLAAVLSLKEPSRTALLLRYYENLPPREISARLDVPLETARSRVRRGLEELRRRLAPEREDARAIAPALVAFAAGRKTKLLAGVAGKVTAIAVLCFLAVGVAFVEVLPHRSPSSSGAGEEQSAGRIVAGSPESPTAPRAAGRREQGPAREVSGTLEAQGVPSEFSGMVEVPAGSFKMGVEARWLKRRYRPGANRRRWHPKLLGGSTSDYWWWCLMLETPEHEATTEAYAIDRYCVTNAQYLKFLDDTSSVTVFIDENKRSIANVAAEIFGEDNVTDEILTTIYWLNAERLDLQKAKIETTNSAAVTAALKNFNAGLKVKLKDFDKLPDKERIAAWVGFTLPKGTGLKAYRRHVPIPWPHGKVTKKIADLPVGGVSERDAEAFAAWAGKHIPTEKEWEKAARGPKNWLYPWGPTWDPEKQVDILNWLNTTTKSKGGLAPDTKDRPLPVEDFPRGQSGYGCFQMLGNVAEWTSSVPRLYPGSKAHGAPWFGNPDYRVIRGAYWGGGLPGTPHQPELVIRNSRRIMAQAPDRGFVASWYANGVGFRCAKDPRPATDVVRARVGELEKAFALPPRDSGEALDVGNVVGVEQDSYVGKGQEGPDHVFVTGPTRAIGIVPFTSLPFSDVNALRAAATAEPKPDAADHPPLLLGLLVWNTDLQLVVSEPATGTSGAKELPSNPGEADFLGIENGRLALFARKILGYRRVAWLEPERAERKVGSVLSGVRLVSDRLAPKGATIDAETGVVTFDLALPARRAESKEVFTFLIRLHFRLGSAPWRQSR